VHCLTCTQPFIFTRITLVWFICGASAWLVGWRYWHLVCSSNWGRFFMGQLWNSA